MESEWCLDALKESLETCEAAAASLRDDASKLDVAVGEQETEKRHALAAVGELRDALEGARADLSDRDAIRSLDAALKSDEAIPLDVAAIILLADAARARFCTGEEVRNRTLSTNRNLRRCQLALTRFPRSLRSAPPRSRMGVRTALAAPLQASPFIIASIFALFRALLKERSWKLQERVVKDLAGAIPVVAPGTRVCI